MKKNNGFIATSILYIFFIVFISMMTTFVSSYLSYEKTMKTKNEAVESYLNQNIEE